MDRYLFRGKRIDNGEWIIGYLWHNKGYYISNDIHDLIEIDPATIGQCTGLKDRNGKLIYEGDIIQELTIRKECDLSRVTYEPDFMKAEVIYKDGSYRLSEISDSPCVYFLASKTNRVYSYEIIGNIHDKA